MKPAAILAALVLATPALAAESLSGSATVADAGALRIGEKTLRITGIVAPGIAQSCSEWIERRPRSYPCGLHARAYLASLVAGKTVFCVTAEASEARGSLARCYVEGQDIGEAMIAAGWAVVAPPASNLYVSAQEAARRAQRGLWAGTFDLPGAAANPQR